MFQDTGMSLFIVLYWFFKILPILKKEEGCACQWPSAVNSLIRVTDGGKELTTRDSLFPHWLSTVGKPMVLDLTWLDSSSFLFSPGFDKCKYAFLNNTPAEVYSLRKALTFTTTKCKKPRSINNKDANRLTFHASPVHTPLSKKTPRDAHAAVRAPAGWQSTFPSHFSSAFTSVLLANRQASASRYTAKDEHSCQLN